MEDGGGPGIRLFEGSEDTAKAGPASQPEAWKSPARHSSTGHRAATARSQGTSPNQPPSPCRRAARSRHETSGGSRRSMAQTSADEMQQSGTDCLPLAMGTRGRMLGPCTCPAMCTGSDTSLGCFAGIKVNIFSSRFYLPSSFTVAVPGG